MEAVPIGIKLPLTDGERKKLRQHNLKIANITSIPIWELRAILNIPIKRAKTLFALAEFQQIPSIGPRIAASLIDLGYFSLDAFKGKDGAKLTDELEELYGYWVDPCVEDSLRLVVHYAEHPNSDRQWWDFTEERKVYREKYGYPETRPTKAWHEMG